MVVALIAWVIECIIRKRESLLLTLNKEPQYNNDMREYQFYYETRKKTGTHTVHADGYVDALKKLKKEIRGIIYFKSIDNQ